MAAERFRNQPRVTPLEVGDTAPDFSLRQTFDRSVSLSETLASGPVLLAFYVFDFGHF